MSLMLGLLLENQSFSFEKVLRSKNQIHDTMHFQGIREHNPAMMLINKQPALNRLNREFSVEKYQNLSENASFYRDFKRIASQNRTTQQAQRRAYQSSEPFEYEYDPSRRE